MEFDRIKSSAALIYDEFIQNAGEFWRLLKVWDVCLVFDVNPSPLYADSRTESWFLMSSPLPQTIIIAIYIYFVTSLGPRLMENRKPLDLKGVLIIYNFSVVALSVYMIYEVSQSVHSRCFVFGVFSTGSVKCTLSHYWLFFIIIFCTLNVLLITTIDVVFLKVYMTQSDFLFQLSSQFIMSGWGTGYSFHCDLVNYSESPQALRVSHPHIPPRMYF